MPHAAWIDARKTFYPTQLETDIPGIVPFLKFTVYVCMYLMIEKGQIAQKRPYWGEKKLKSKIYV